jgi:hypothetical protein
LPALRQNRTRQRHRDWLVHIATYCVDDHPDKSNAAANAGTLKTTTSTVGATKRQAINDLASEQAEEQSAGRRLPSASGSVLNARSILPPPRSVHPTPMSVPGAQLEPSSASVERNWSTQGHIFSTRRVPLDHERGTKLVSVHWNLRALDMYEEFKEHSRHA